MGKRDRQARKKAARPPDPEPGGLSLTKLGTDHARAIVLAGMALNFILCLLLFEPKLHTGGDSSSYVLLAESVLRVGDGYADTLNPGPPQPHIQYPPGFAVLLAPLVAIFGRNVLVLKLLPLLLTVASVPLFAAFARRRSEPGVWVLLTMAFAANPLLVDYSHWILSEAPFVAVTLLTLVLTAKSDESEKVGPWFVLGILAAVASFYVRSIAAVLLAAGSLSYFVRKRWRQFLVFSVVGASLSLPWLIRNKLLRGASTPYIEQFLLKSVYVPEAGYLDFWGLLRRFFDNVTIYAGREMPRVLVGSDSVWAAGLPVRSAAIGVSLLVALGFGVALLRRRGMAEFYFGLSCVAVFLFEEVVSDVRYLLPLLPFVLLYLVEGIDTAATWARRPARGAGLSAAALVAVLVLGVTAQAARVPANVRMLSAYMAGDQYAGYPPNWRNFFQAADWVKANTPPDAVVTVRKPRLFNLWTDRKVVLYPFSTDPDSVLRVVLPTDFVVVDQVSQTTFRYLVPAMERAPDRFSQVYQTAAPTTWVFRVHH